MKNEIKQWFEDNLFEIVIFIFVIVVLVFAIMAYVNNDSKEKVSSYETNNFDYKKVEIVSWKSGEPIFEAEGRISVDNYTEKEMVVVIETSKKEYKKIKFHLSEDYMYYVEEVENNTSNPYNWSLNFGK